MPRQANMRPAENTRRSLAGGDDGDTARRILEAAGELMADRGFDGTGRQAIADHASVNKALLFYHFGNKANLFERVLDHQLRGLYDALAGAADRVRDEPPGAALHAVLDAYIDYVEQNRAYARLVQLELARSGGRHDLIGEYNGKNFKLLKPLMVALGAKKGPCSAEQLFISFGGMVLHYFASAPVLAAVLSPKRAVSPSTPAGRKALAERRAHVHWMVDAALAGLSSP